MACPASSNLASGLTKTISAAAPITDEITTGITVALMIAGILRSAFSARTLAMK